MVNIPRIAKQKIEKIDPNRFPKAVELLESLAVQKEHSEEFKKHLACNMEHGHINDALSAIDQAKERGIDLRIEPEQYPIALNACITDGMIDNAEKVVSEASKAGVELRITREMYNIALDKCIIDGSIERAENVVVSARKVNVDLMIMEEQYETALNVCIEDGEIEKANKVVAGAAKANIELEITLEQHKTALDVCVKNHWPTYTANIAISASKVGINDLDLYQTVLDTCIAGGWVSDTDKTIAAAAKVGIELHVTLEQYRTALDKCIERDSMNVYGFISNLLVNATRDGIKDVDLYLTALNAVKRRGVNYKEVFHDVLKAEVYDDRIFTNAIEYFGSNGETDEISSIITHLTKISGERDQWRKGNEEVKKSRPTLWQSVRELIARK